MESLEALNNQADLIIEQSHEALASGQVSHLPVLPLYRKLAEIYAQEAVKPTRLKSVSLTHKLLEKLVKRDNLNCLLVNLYRGNDGFSIGLKLASGQEIETVRLPYEDDQFLSYVDSEQLPPMLLDLLDESNVDIYYSGCIIAEVRDHRRSMEPAYDPHYVLLRPTNQSIIADVASLTRDLHWTQDERLQLESELVRRLAPPLHLSPSPLVAVIHNRLHQKRFRFSTLAVRRAAKRYSQASLNRQKRFEGAPAPKSLRLFNFLSAKKDRLLNNKSLTKPMLPTMSEEMPLLSVPETIDVSRLARVCERPNTNGMDNSAVFMEELVLETERGQGRIYHTKLTILQRKTDEVFFGELYVDRDYQEGKLNGSTCKFQLGAHQQVLRYIQQFKEIFTEDWRKSVKMTQRVAGQPPVTTFTPGSRDRKESQEQRLTQVVQGQAHPPPTPPLQQLSLPLMPPVTSQMGLQQQEPLRKSPVTTTTSSTLSGLLSSSQTMQQLPGQQLMVGRGVMLSSLLGGGVTGQVGGGAPTLVASGLSASKMAVPVLAGSNIGKMSLPSLTAQLIRPIVVASQTQSSLKSQGLNVSLGENLTSPQHSLTSPHMTSPHGVLAAPSVNAPGLQALLAGSPSADNPAPHRGGPTLLERLSAQSSVPKDANKVVCASPSPHQGSMHLDGSNGGVAPPNINIASLNLPGLNVAGLHNLPTGLQSLQNVQVSIPGLPPISLAVNVPMITSPPPTSLFTTSQSLNTTVTSSPTAVMFTTQPGHPVQLPLGQMGSPTLLAQLTAKSQPGQTVTSMLQVSGVNSQLLTSLRGAGRGVHTTQQVQVSIAGSHQIPLSVTFGSDHMSGGSTTGGSLAPSLGPTLAPKPVAMQMAVPKGPLSLQQMQLQQKLAAIAKQQQLQQLSQQQQPP